MQLTSLSNFLEWVPKYFMIILIKPSGQLEFHCKFHCHFMNTKISRLFTIFFICFQTEGKSTGDKHQLLEEGCTKGF